MKYFRIVLFTFLTLTSAINKGTAITKPVPGNLIISIKQNTSATAFSLQIANLQQLKTAISLLNEKGEVLHSKRVENSNGIRIKYMLGEFPDGKYKLELNWNNQIKIWEITKSGNLFFFQLEGKSKKEGYWVIKSEAFAIKE
jgi:hypothetical protein